MQLLDLVELSILLVEPSRTQLKLIVRHLASEGIVRVEGVTKGQEALASMKRNAPDLVISAMYLPDMTAVVLLETMRNAPGLEHIPFMLVSSETDFHILDPLRQAGVMSILPKPFDHDDLRRALQATVSYIEPREITLDSIDVDVLRVLVVDDSPMARKHLCRVLNSMGIHNIQTAVDGQDATAKLRGDCFDLVVTDLNMPKMDGRGLVEYIRQTLDNPTLPILMVTSEQDMARLHQVEEAGVSAICDKPFELRTVQEILHRVIRPD